MEEIVIGNVILFLNSAAWNAAIFRLSKAACNLKQYNGSLTQAIVRNWRGVECMITEALRPQVHYYTDDKAVKISSLPLLTETTAQQLIHTIWKAECCLWTEQYTELQKVLMTLENHS